MLVFFLGRMSHLERVEKESWLGSLSKMVKISTNSGAGYNRESTRNKEKEGQAAMKTQEKLYRFNSPCP